MIERLKKNVSSVKNRIREAALRSGREPDSVRLVGVTKYVDAATTVALVAAGCGDLGENRPQVLWDKAAAIADPNINWHLVGHLQRNKAKRTVELAVLIHSVDSVRLLTAINKAGREAGTVVRTLLEVNVSGEAAKHGFAAAELSAALESAGTLDHIAVEGLMCMAGLEGDLDQARREFAQLRELAEGLRSQTPDNVRLTELSMGMSGDFEIAIEEGATLVRVGSLLFEGLR